MLLSICFNSSLCSTLLSGLRKQAKGRRERKKGEQRLFLIPGFYSASGEKDKSFLQPRKEEFPPASDCLTCKNVAFVAELRSFFLAGCL